jgi:undecaprenyl-diphosphatase
LAFIQRCAASSCASNDKENNVLKTNQAALPAQHSQKLSRDAQREGLRSPGLLGRYPLIGLAMILLGGGLFAVMAINLQTDGALTQLDIQIVNDLHTIALGSSPLLLDIMKFGFYLAQYGFIAIGALLVLYFLYKRYWPELSMVLIAWGGEALLWYGLSGYFNRPRPTFETSVWRQMTVPGFPSGHSLSAVMCFGFLAYLIMPKIKSPFGKVLLVIITIALIIYAGYSRVFVGDHYPTDVLAGYGLGLAWSGLVYTAVELFARRKMNTRIKGD